MAAKVTVNADNREGGPAEDLAAAQRARDRTRAAFVLGPEVHAENSTTIQTDEVNRRADQEEGFVEVRLLLLQQRVVRRPRRRPTRRRYGAAPRSDRDEETGAISGKVSVAASRMRCSTSPQRPPVLAWISRMPRRPSGSASQNRIRHQVGAEELLGLDEATQPRTMRRPAQAGKRAGRQVGDGRSAQGRDGAEFMVASLCRTSPCVRRARPPGRVLAQLQGADIGDDRPAVLRLDLARSSRAWRRSRW